MTCHEEKKKKKGALGIDFLSSFAISMGSVIIVVSVVAMILAAMSTNVTNGNASLVLSKGLLAIVGFSDWFLILIIVGIAVVLLSFVMMLRYMGGGGGRGKA